MTHIKNDHWLLLVTPVYIGQASNGESHNMSTVKEDLRHKQLETFCNETNLSQVIQECCSYVCQNDVE